MASSEVMTSSTHSFAYSYRLVKKCFGKICETWNCHNFLIFQPIFISFSLLCLKNFTLSSKLKLNLLWSSSLNTILEVDYFFMVVSFTIIALAFSFTNLLCLLSFHLIKPDTVIIKFLNIYPLQEKYYEAPYPTKK